MTARAASAAAGPSISSMLGASQRAGPAGRLDQPGPADPGPAQAPDLVPGAGAGTFRLSTVRAGAATEQGNEGDGQVGRRLPGVGLAAGAQRDGQRADARAGWP